jgi:FIST N domain
MVVWRPHWRSIQANKQFVYPADLAFRGAFCRRERTCSDLEGVERRTPYRPRSRSRPPAEPQAPPQFVRTLRFAQFSEPALSAADFGIDGGAPILALGFIPPHLDFHATVRLLQSRLPGETTFIAVSTAGESSCDEAPDGPPLYCAADGAWSSVVMQLFSPALIAQVSTHTVPLFSADIRGGQPQRSTDARVELIRDALAKVRPAFPINPRETLALTFIDGLSASESFLMEAVHADGRFPCPFVGGCSTAGPSSTTSPSSCSCAWRRTILVSHADPIRRTVAQVVEIDELAPTSIVTALSRHFRCAPETLAARMQGYSLGIELDGEIFVRSIVAIDAAKGHGEVLLRRRRRRPAACVEVA